MEGLIKENIWLLLLLAVWIFPWKGVALWKAARTGQKVWFIIILVANTLALLEIFYIFFVARKKSQDLVETKTEK